MMLRNLSFIPVPARRRLLVTGVLPLAAAWIGTFPCLAEEENRWEPAIQAFEKQDQKTMPTEGAVLFLGSSSIRLWDIEASFPDLVTIKRGFGGSMISDVNHFVNRIVLPYKPKTIVLYAGDNDIALGKTAEQVVTDFKAFVKHVHASLPETRILFLSIKPSVARWSVYDEMKRANEDIRRYCEADEKLVFVDVGSCLLGADGTPRADLLMSDGLHLNTEGYAAWNKVLKPLLADAKKREE